MQGMLASHPAVFSLPETFFFVKATQGHFFKRKFLWPAIKIYGHLEGIVRELGRDDLVKNAKVGLFARKYANSFTEVLDRLTADSGKKIWVEKTPWHLRSIEEITKQVPGAAFIHIVRDGKDVVASLYNATHLQTQEWATLQPSWYPGFLKFKPYSIEDCVKIWNEDISLTREVIGRANHFVLNYDELVAHPESVIREVADFIGINFDEAMLAPTASVGRITRKQELWKINNASSIKKSNNHFSNIFDQEQQAWIVAHLESKLLCDLSNFSRKKSER